MQDPVWVDSLVKLQNLKKVNIIVHRNSLTDSDTSTNGSYPPSVKNSPFLCDFIIILKGIVKTHCNSVMIFLQLVEEPKEFIGKYVEFVWSM